MTITSSSSCTAGPRRVAFEGAEVIEFDADQAPVVKLYGVSSSSDASAQALECQARGLDSATTLTLTLQYVQELQRYLRQRGFQPISDDLRELQTQRRVVELLQLMTDVEREVERPVEQKKNQTLDVLDPATLRRAQLATKQLQSLVDDGYAFGRRFLAVATYVETLDSHELLLAAQTRGLQPPKLLETQRAAVKLPDRELLGLHGTAEGRPLRSLTLRQLVTEARGLLGPGGATARDAKGKRSKRAWVDLLRPVMVAEVRAAKICEQEEQLLRDALVAELEREKQREQHQRVVRLIETVVSADCTEPEDDDSTLGNEDKQVKHSDEGRKYLEALAKTVCVPSEDVGMRE